MGDLQKLVKPGLSCCESGAHKKLITSHQIVLQALQTYHNHMHTTLPTFIQNKVKELFHKSAQLCEIHVRTLNSDKGGVHVDRKDSVQVRYHVLVFGFCLDATVEKARYKI